jgi:hypothetical protein
MAHGMIDRENMDDFISSKFSLREVTLQPLIDNLYETNYPCSMQFATIL